MKKKKVGRPKKNKAVTIKKTVSNKRTLVKWDVVWKDVSFFAVVSTFIYTILGLLWNQVMLWFIPLVVCFTFLVSMFVTTKEEWVEVQEEV